MVPLFQKLVSKDNRTAVFLEHPDCVLALVPELAEVVVNARETCSAEHHSNRS